MKKKVLIVDDSPFVYKQIKEALEHSNYEILADARSGEEGLKLFDELKPDLVILDIIMPGIDGIETATIIREKDPNAKIVMLSSMCDEYTTEEVRKIGIEYLIPKPFDENSIKMVLDEVFKK